MRFDIREWYDEVQEGITPISFCGQISRDLVTDILQQIEDLADKKMLSKTLKKKMYSISLELLQNIFHHADNPNTRSDSNTGEAVFILLQIESGYEIIIGNFVRKIHLRKIKDRIKQLNSLSKEEIKILYKLILNNQQFSQKGGGGLGLIDISRKIDSSLSVETYKYNSEYFFLRFSILVS
ncbi:MAG: SiaB family protein kinase [Bacteroidota bacterium]|nr:SiaB family protein kinase [Bacteroidota bacterium]